MDSLFPDLPEVLSPRLQWMRKHGITTYHFEEDNEWQAMCEGKEISGSGNSEEAALLDLALKLKIPNWKQ